MVQSGALVSSQKGAGRVFQPCGCSPEPTEETGRANERALRYSPGDVSPAQSLVSRRGDGNPGSPTAGPVRRASPVIPAQAGIQVFLMQSTKLRKYGLQEKNKDVIFSQNEPEKLFRINKTPPKSAKTNRKMARKAEKCRFAKLPDMNSLAFYLKKRTGTNRKNEPERGYANEDIDLPLQYRVRGRCVPM
jgi:hypothetical protein